jgi:hypothetical protein
VITYRRAGKTNNEESDFILLYIFVYVEKNSTDIRAPFCLNERKTDTERGRRRVERNNYLKKGGQK